MGVFEFLNRHRNKILLAGGAAGALVVVNKVLANYEKQWQNNSSKGYVLESKKKEIHFENIINECNQLCQRMSLQVINRQQELLDDTHLIDNLKQSRADNNLKDKVEIWKSLRINILTRLLSELYCTCIVVCYMRVQMSIVGGQVYVTSIDYNSTKTDLTHMKTYAKYNAIFGSFCEQKFEHLIHPLESIISETLNDYNIDYNISIQDFKVILEKIKSEFTFYLTNNDADKLTSIDLDSICTDSGKLTEENEKMLKQMLEETQDILEGDDFKHVLQSSIEVGYAILLDTLLGAFIKLESKLSNSSSKDSSGFSNPNSIQVPLVKILPQIRNNYEKRSETDKKALVNHLLCLDVLNCFAANVYEAFCVPK